VISLAHGVSPMYLTRAKMLIAGVLIAAALTTGVGSRIMSTADAQAPPADPNADSVKKAIDWLKTHPAPDRWEYKFLPIEKTLTIADLQKVLSASDREGWEYCGTQDLVVGERAQDAKRGSTIPHMVFKRRRHIDSDSEAQSSVAAALSHLARQVEESAKKEAAEEEARARWLSVLGQNRKRVQGAGEEMKKESNVERQKAGADRLELEARRRAGVEAVRAEQAAAAAVAERARAEQLEAIIQNLRDEQKALTDRLKELELDRPQGKEKAAQTPGPTQSLSVSLKYVKAAEAITLLEK